MIKSNYLYAQDINKMKQKESSIVKSKKTKT